MKYVKELKEIPKHPHYGVLVPKSIFIEGDEESYHRPGHGYGSHTINAWDYAVFDSKEEWATYIQMETLRQTGVRSNFLPVHISPAQIDVNVSINIQES